MKCKICQSNSSPVFQSTILHKYKVNYYKCGNCEFIQTEEPYWLSEAYLSPITSLDLGLVSRNIANRPIVETLVKFFFDRKGKFIDYGGGYGMFVRQMRDAGMDFYRQDIHCENLFAKHFDIIDLSNYTGQFELLTAFEVFEHLEHPLEEFEKMVKLSNNIFFSTCLYPKNQDLREWWYLIPETGQHISLYSKKSLVVLAKQFGMNFYSYNDTLHLITKSKIHPWTFRAIFNSPFRLIYNRLTRNKSLLDSDRKMIIKKNNISLST